MSSAKRRFRLRIALLLGASMMFQGLTCTQEQIQQQVELGLSAALNLGAIEVANELLSANTGP
ncbi:MAG: hypothetical protein ACE5E5_15355 [Phycisphaerae bacterium]